MKKILQYIALFIFFLFVVGLGIVAYRMASNVLVFAFYGQENQQGKELFLTVNRPGVISRIIPAGALLDEQAIKNSLLLNGEISSSDNFDILFSESFVKIIPKQVKNGDIITLSADLYNKNKKTSFQLPQDVVLTVDSDFVYDLEIIPLDSLPKQAKFEIKSDTISQKNIQFYVYYPASDASCFDENFPWNYKDFSSLQMIETTDIESNIVSLDLDTTKQKQCVVAGYRNFITPVIERKLENFSLSGSIIKDISDEKNFRNSLNITTTSPLIANISQESPEYVLLERELKKQIASKISFSPEILFSENDIYITDSGFTLTTDFIDESKYTVFINDLEDIYGRVASMKMSFTPKNNTSIGIDIVGEKKNFSSLDDMKINVYSNDLQKRNYDIKICRLDVTGFSRISQIITEKNIEKIPQIYDLLTSSHTSDCQKTVVDFADTSALATFSLSEKFDKNLLRPGLYVVAFRNLEDVTLFSQGVFPVVFSFSNTDILIEAAETGSGKILILDSVSGSPLSGQEIEIFEQISDENNNISYATGSILGKTNDIGILYSDFSHLSEKKIFLVSRSAGKFGYFYDLLPKFLEKSSAYQANLELNGNIFLHGDTVNIFAKVLKNNENLQNEMLHIFLMNPNGETLKKWDIKPNNNGIIAAEYVFEENDDFGEYIIYITSENGGKIASQTITLYSGGESRQEVVLDFSVIDAVSGVPKNLRERVNNSGEKLYYSHEYFAPIELDIRASVVNSIGEKFKNTPFQYTLSRKKNGGEIEIIYEGKGRFDSDGIGRALLATEFSSYYHDVEYILNVKTQDITTGEILIGEKSLKLLLSQDLKSFDDTIAPDFELQKEFVGSGEVIALDFSSNIADNIAHKYYYEILDSSENSLKKEIILDKNLKIQTNDLPAGKYTIKIYPVTTEGIVAPTQTIAQKIFFINGITENNFTDLSVFLNKKDTINTFDMLIVAPKDTTHFLVSQLGDVISSEYITLSGGVMQKEISFSGSIEKQSLQVLARTSSGMLFSEKEVLVQKDNIFPEVEFVHSGAILMGSGQEMKLLFKNIDSTKQGNISLKIIEGNANSTFNQNIFSYNSSLQNAFFGNIFQKSFIEKKIKKESKKQEVYERNIYFNPSVSLDNKNEFLLSMPTLESGKKYTIFVNYILPNGEKKIFTKNVSVTQDFVISSELPKSVFPGDKMDISIIAQNFTNTISATEWQIDFLSADTPMSLSGSMNLNIVQPEIQNTTLRIPDSWRGEIPFSLTLKKNNSIVAQNSGMIFVDEIPSMGLGKNIIAWTNSGSEISFASDLLLDNMKSYIEIRTATDFSVVIPGLLEDLNNSKKSSQTDILQEIFLKNSIQKNPETANLNTENISEQLIIFLEKQNFNTWKEELSEKQLLDNMRLLLELHKTGLVLPGTWHTDLQKYFSENILPKIDEKSDDIKVKILLIQTILKGDTDEQIFSKIDKNNLSESGFLDYMENFILAKRILSNELYDEFLIRFEKNINPNSLQLARRAHLAKYARIGFASGKIEKANEILNKHFIKTTSGISSIYEKYETILLALIHAHVVSVSDATVKFSSDKITAEEKLSLKTKISFWKISREKLGTTGKIITENKTPIFYEIREKNYLEAPSLFISKESQFLKISQKVEKIDESAGVDDSGEFRKTEEISGNFLNKNALYKVTITTNIQNTYENVWPLLAMRVYILPGAEIFSPERNIQSFLGQTFPLDFSKIFHEKNYLLLEKNAGEGDKTLEYVYYFRPKNTGSYLLPGNFVYFADGKEFFANSSHQYFHVK